MRSHPAFPPPPPRPLQAPPWRQQGAQPLPLQPLHHHGRSEETRFEVVRQLDVGTTSEVLLAIARGPMAFERTVVLKRLRMDLTGDSGAFARASLGREALAHARLAHPSIVRLYDFIEDEAGRLTLVLEHVDGPSLAAVVAALRSRTPNGLDELAIWYIGYRMFQALAAAHFARDPMTREYAPLIHRDISPGNVLVPWDGYVKLTDFSVARVAGVPSDTQPGVIKGSLGYLAPEQVRGERATVRSDIYGACLVLRELLLREPVFPCENKTEFELASAMASPKLVPLARIRPELPEHVTHAIDRGLEPDPEARSLAAEDMVERMRDALGDVERGRERLVGILAQLRHDGTRAAVSAGYANAALVPGIRVAASLFDESSASIDTQTDVDTDAKFAWLHDANRALEREAAAQAAAWEARTSDPTAVSISFHPGAVASTSSRPPPSSRIVPRLQQAPGSSRNEPEQASWRHGQTTTPAASPFVFDTPQAMTRSLEPSAVSGLPAAARPSWPSLDAPDAAVRIYSGKGFAKRATAMAAVLVGLAIGGGLGLRERARTTTAQSTQVPTTRAPERPRPQPASFTASTASHAPPSPPSPAPAPQVAETQAVPAAASSPNLSAPVPQEITHHEMAPSALGIITPSRTHGTLVTSAAERGHRIFVDDRVVGAGGEPISVRCGPHEVRVGSAGRRRNVEIPCGGSVEVAR